MRYTAPVDELRFALRVHGNLNDILQLPVADGLDEETVDAVLEEAARFAGQEWAPTNSTGDLNGATLSDGLVHTHPDLAAAYREFCRAGWAGLRAPAAQLRLSDGLFSEQLLQAVAAAEESIAYLVENTGQAALTATASAAYLRQMGLTLGAIGLARASLAAQNALDGKTENLFGNDFYTAQQHYARVYAAYVLPQVYTCAAQIKQGQALLDVPPEMF